jgi:hypothetical protein
MGCRLPPIRIIAAGLTLTAALFAQQQQQSTRPLSAGALVSALDEQVQLRFLDPRLGFGITRLCGPIGHGALGQTNQTLRRLPQPSDPHWRNAQCGGRDWAPFRPRNAQEEWVVSEVKRARLEIWTLLVGGARRTLEGPVVVGNDAPREMDEIRRQLLSRVVRTPIPDDALNQWQVSVKPVRASRETCVGCHADQGRSALGPPPIKGLKIGDPLGYLIYLYRPLP